MLLNEAEILLVEDNDADVELTMLALRGENICNKISVVRDGAEALDFLFCRGAYASRVGAPMPKLVLLDLKLPKVDGLEVLRQLKQNPQTRIIPVVILTASREESDLLNGYQFGTNSYIQKPVDFNQFRERVKQLGLYWLVVNQVPETRSAERAA